MEYFLQEVLKCAIKWINLDMLIHEKSYKKISCYLALLCIESRGGVNLERQEVDLCLDTSGRTGDREWLSSTRRALWEWWNVLDYVMTTKFCEYSKTAHLSPSAIVIVHGLYLGKGILRETD